MPAVPRTLSHVVYFVPDAAKGEAFYRDRLGFVTTDTFTGVGPFMRSAGMDDHHCLFMIQTAAHAGLRALHLPHGQRHRGAARRAAFRAARLDQLLGPRQHLLGSNWFWYFNSPLAATSSTTPTWTSTTTTGLRARRRCRRTTRSCSSSPRGTMGAERPPPKQGLEPWRVLDLCRLDELGEGQARGFDPGGIGRDTLFAVRAAGVRVYRNSCPHLDVRRSTARTASSPPMASASRCYAHGAEFLPDSGLCVYGPCLGESLSALEHRIEDGWPRPAGATGRLNGAGIAFDDRSHPRTRLVNPAMPRSCAHPTDSPRFRARQTTRTKRERRHECCE
jgi:nitrite reductase/ring-hydroxylating ferredoxin subunit/catechol 2,3-dioxygenase-like lactoylglutathione lyase family enzyme